jgi:hypothetical protein
MFRGSFQRQYQRLQSTPFVRQGSSRVASVICLLMSERSPVVFE